MKQKNVLTSMRSGVGTGTTSLLMIFTVLCFATLAMLSLSTAAANQRIRGRGLDADAAIAAAKGGAARQLAVLDGALLELQMGGDADEEAYYAEALAAAEALGWEVDAEARTAVLRLPVDEHNELLTELALQAPGEAERYTVARQITRLAAGWEAEEEGQVWVPG